MAKIAVKSVVVRPRDRKEYGDIEEMAKSLSRYGLIQPIVLDQDNVLVAGGRRLAGAASLGWTEIDFTRREDLDDVSRKELELEENLQRKDLTWPEEVRAIRALYDLRVAKHGPAANLLGVELERSDYTMQDAASELGRSKGSVVQYIQLARALDEFPELSEEATISAAWKRYHREKELQARSELARRDRQRAEHATAHEPHDEHGRAEFTDSTRPDQQPNHDVRQQIRKAGWKGKGTLYHADSRDVLRLLAEKQVRFDCIVTDPPFGLGMFRKGSTTSGQRLAENEGGMYDDDPHKILEMLDLVFQYAAQLLKPDGHAYVFFHMTRYEETYQMLRKHFGTCEETPLIWAKNTPAIGDPNVMWVYSYEPCFWINRGRSMVIPQAFNVLRYDTIPPTQKIHPTQKPTALLRNIIAASCIAGETVLDPFAGSGSTLIAASQVGCHFVGVERDEAFYRKACEFVSQELASEEKHGEVRA